MKNKEKSISKENAIRGAEFAEQIWRESWTYICTVVDTVREPFLILDKDLRVMAANESFYRTFKVNPSETENKLVYKLGDGQWNIPSLRKLLEDILHHNTFFKGFEVVHEFPHIGKKIMLLNARQTYGSKTAEFLFPPIILLAMEDVTGLMDVAEKLAMQENQFRAMMNQRTKLLEDQVKILSVKIKQMKKKA